MGESSRQWTPSERLARAPSTPELDLLRHLQSSDESPRLPRIFQGCREIKEVFDTVRTVNVTPESELKCLYYTPVVLIRILASIEQMHTNHSPFPQFLFPDDQF